MSASTSSAQGTWKHFLMSLTATRPVQLRKLRPGGPRLAGHSPGLRLPCDLTRGTRPACPLQDVKQAEKQSPASAHCLLGCFS